MLCENRAVSVVLDLVAPWPRSTLGFKLGKSESTCLRARRFKKEKSKCVWEFMPKGLRPQMKLFCMHEGIDKCSLR